jgi:hypothetical protein
MIMYLGNQTPFYFCWCSVGWLYFVYYCFNLPWVASLDAIYFNLSVLVSCFLSMCCLGLMLVIALPFFLLHTIFNE